MIFEQYYLECLSQASYLIGDPTTGKAAVVDPRRDVSEYLSSASDAGLTIEYVIETHFHADFLSGHLELAARSGAEICYGSRAETEFVSRKLAHREQLVLGDVVLEIRHTPGHTPESISIVVFDQGVDEAPYGVLTGDTLFIGDVGRPDLLSSVGMTGADLASQLYDSLHEELLTLPDATQLYPGHGAGSSCGKSLSSATSCSIGVQRETNYALAPMSRQEFIDVVTEGQTAPPAYFSFDASLNRLDHDLLDEEALPPLLEIDEVVQLQRRGVVVLDTRDPGDFARGHLLGSINVGLAGRYSEFAGGVILPGARMVLVTDAGMELESKNRLARIGYDNVVGALRDPLAAFLDHPNDVEVSSRVDVAGLVDALAEIPDLQLVDVRQPGETEAGVIDGAMLIPLTQLNQRLASLDASRPTLIYCAGGFRSSIAASRLLAAGFADVSDLLGGYGAWAAATPAHR